MNNKDNFANIIATQNELIATLQEKNRDLVYDMNKLKVKLLSSKAENQELKEYIEELIADLAGEDW